MKLYGIVGPSQAERVYSLTILSKDGSAQFSVYGNEEELSDLIDQIQYSFQAMLDSEAEIE